MVETHLELRSPMFGECLLAFWGGNFIGIDEIARGFTTQVGYRKLLNFMVMLCVLQMVPKRRSPNRFIYQLK